MDEKSAEILNEILTRTENDIIILAIVILVGLVVFFIPFYITMNKNKKTVRDDELKERQQILDVVKANTSAMTKLETTLDLNNSGMIEMLNRIDANASDVAIKLAKLLTSHNTMTTNLNDVLKANESYVSHMNETKGHIDKISLIEKDSTEIKYHLEQTDTKLTKIDERTERIVASLDNINNNMAIIVNDSIKEKK